MTVYFKFYDVAIIRILLWPYTWDTVFVFFLIKAIVTSLASTLVFDVCNSLWSFMLMVLPSTVAIQCYKISSTAREEFSSYIIMTSIYFLALKILHIHSFKLIDLTEREMHVRNISNSYSEFLNLKIWSCYLLHAFSYDKVITPGGPDIFSHCMYPPWKNNLWLLGKWVKITNK